MSINAHELSNRLLNALDNNYNVVDMHTVNEIISILEKFNITKELLETTRLGKHVNELRRKTSDPQLARRAKVLVKRWRDLVIPSVASPGHTALPGSNRSSAERQVRRLGTPLTSPALSRQVVSPAVPSPRPQSRPAWGGYESDSQDVILVDDDPAPPAAPSPLAILHKPLTPSVKRPPSPQPLYDEKKAKRDKKPKKRRGHSRAGSGTEATSPLPNMGGITIPAPSPPAPPPASAPLPPPPALLAPPPAAAAPHVAVWRDRNGTERRRNGKKSKLDPYTAMVNRMPTAGAKKVKTTKELLEEIQSRGSKPPASPGSPDVMLIEDSCPIKVESPLRNGGASPRAPSPAGVAAPLPAPPPLPPLEEAREYHECTCEAAGERQEGQEWEGEAACPAARRVRVHPVHVRALHHAYLPGINGTRAPIHPHQYAVRKLTDPERPDLFTSVVPLYKYSDYADDRCAKNMSRVPLCSHIPWTEFAPHPPDPPPPPSPPPVRPYPVDDVAPEKSAAPSEENTRDSEATDCSLEGVGIEAEMVGVPSLEPSERLKAPILSMDEETQFFAIEKPEKMDVEDDFETEHQDHRTVERTKEDLNGQELYDRVRRTIDGIPYDYGQMSLPPVVTLPEEAEEASSALDAAFVRAEAETERLEFDRPPRPDNFAEWHECARLGELIALPYVVID